MTGGFTTFFKISSFLWCLLYIASCDGDVCADNDLAAIFYPDTPDETLHIRWWEEDCVYFNVSHVAERDLKVYAQIKDTHIAPWATGADQTQHVISNNIIYIEGVTDKICLYGNYLGKTKLAIVFIPFSTNIEDTEIDWSEEAGCYNMTSSGGNNQTNSVVIKEVHVVNEETTLYKIYLIVIAIMVVLINTGFGCRLELESVRGILKKPAALALGLACQLILLPLVSRHCL